MSEFLLDCGDAMDMLATCLRVEGGGCERIQHVLSETLKRLPEVDSLALECESIRPTRAEFDLVHFQSVARNQESKAAAHALTADSFYEQINIDSEEMKQFLAFYGHEPFHGLLTKFCEETGLDVEAIRKEVLAPYRVDNWRWFGRATSERQLVHVVASVAEGRQDLDNTSLKLVPLIHRLVEATALGIAWPSSALLPAVELSKAQQRVYDLAIKGLTEKAIAQQLHRSHHTVHTHLKAIYAKFHVSSRAELLALHLDRSLNDFGHSATDR